MTTPERPPAGKLLLDARNNLKWSRATAAQYAGISESWWRRIEDGGVLSAGKWIPAHPTDEILIQAAQAVDLDPDDVLTAAGRPPQKTVTHRSKQRTELIRIIDAMNPIYLPAAKAALEAVLSVPTHPTE